MIEIDIQGATEAADHRQETEVARGTESLKKTGLKAAYPKVLWPPGIVQKKRRSKKQFFYYMYFHVLIIILLLLLLSCLIDLRIRPKGLV